MGKTIKSLVYLCVNCMFITQGNVSDETQCSKTMPVPLI